MVHATASRSGQPSGTKQLYEVRPLPPYAAATVAVNQRRLRNLSVPTSRLSKTASSIPAPLPLSRGRGVGVRGDGSRQARSGGIETSVSRERLPSAASAQLVCTRSSGRIGGRGRRSSKVGGVGPAPARGPIQSRRGQACAAWRRGGLGVPQETSPGRGRRDCPS
jgi:hypothetical protein